MKKLAAIVAAMFIGSMGAIAAPPEDVPGKAVGRPDNPGSASQAATPAQPGGAGVPATPAGAASDTAVAATGAAPGAAAAGAVSGGVPVALGAAVAAAVRAANGSNGTTSHHGTTHH